MDGNRFDRLVKAGTTSGSRRSAIGVGAAVLAGIAFGESRDDVAAHRHRHHPKPDPDACLNPIEPVACQATGGCDGCVTAAGHLCRLNPCVVSDITFSCLRTKEGKQVCVRQPSGTACGDFPRCRDSKACGKGHVCGKSCCNDGQFRCFPRCSNTTATRMAAVGDDSGDRQPPMPRW